VGISFNRESGASEFHSRTVQWYLFCLLVVLVKLSVLTKLLDIKTALRKPDLGEGIVSTKPRPKSVHDFLGLVHCFIVL